MYRQTWFYIVTCIITAFIFVGCNIYGSPGQLKVVPKALTIMISSNTVSNFTPCGCHSGKWGGMPRRGTIFTNVENEVEWPVILVDTGAVVQGSRSEFQDLKDGYIFESYQILGYDAVNVGYNELNLGYEELARVGETYGIPWISANTYGPGVYPDLPVIAGGNMQGPVTVPPGTPGADPSSGIPESAENETPGAADSAEGSDTLLFLPYRIVEPEGAPGFKVGIIGMMMQDAGRLNPKRETFSFEPYLNSLPANVDLLRNREKVDLVILLTDNDNFDNVDQSVFAGIDIVIGGNATIRQSPNSSLNPDNPLYRPAVPQRVPTPPEGSEATPEGGDVTPENGEDTGAVVLEPLDLPLMVPKGAGRARLIRRFDIFIDAGRIVDYYTTEYRVDDTNVDDPRLADVARNYDTNILAVELMSRVERTYAGSQACEECHPGFLAAWAEDGHFNSYDTIVGDNKLDDRTCTRCHALGFIEDPRLLTYDLISENYRNVGCEACHPTGIRHITFQRHLAELTPELRANATTPDAMAAAIDEVTCLQCHTGEWGVGFDFATSIEAARQICLNVVPPPPGQEPPAPVEEAPTDTPVETPEVPSGE